MAIEYELGEVGAYALIPQPEQAPNESKRANAEVEENVEANEKKEAMQMRDLQERALK